MDKHFQQFKKDGYFVLKNAITTEEAREFRERSDHYFDNFPTSPFIDGFTVPGWAGTTPELGALNTFHEDERLLAMAKLSLGSNDIIYTDHSDLHRNIVTLWHRDHFDYWLGSPDSEPFQGFTEEGFWDNREEFATADIETEEFPGGFWDNDHKIIKACLLLQDHRDNDFGLWMMAGSHVKGVKGEERCIHSSPTDLIIFDHRITHRGQGYTRQFHQEKGQSRCLLAWGFGVNNKHTMQFMSGCNERQQFYRKRMK